MDIFRRMGTQKKKFKIQFFIGRLKFSSFIKGKIYIVLKRGRIGIKDLSSIIDLFKSYDPVHPGHSHSSDPILYLDRLELFMSEVLDREIDIKKEIESEKLSHFSSRYSGGSVRFLLEDYYSIKY
jgi:hypothetical protein